jgi:hypothetical protein
LRLKKGSQRVSLASIGLSSIVATFNFFDLPPVGGLSLCWILTIHPPHPSLSVWKHAPLPRKGVKRAQKNRTPHQSDQNFEERKKKQHKSE